MKEQRIDFQTAKLAKQKGYNEICGWYFTPEGEPKSGIPVTGAGYEQRHLAANFMRPTQSVLRCWLRETHGIHIKIEPYVKHHGIKYMAHISVEKNRGRESICLDYVSTFMRIPTFEAALELALELSLNQIKDHETST